MKKQRIIPGSYWFPRSGHGERECRSTCIKSCGWACGLGTVLLASVFLLGCDKQPRHRLRHRKSG